MSTIAALLPMRHNSERVPGKNYRMFAGVPLYHHIMRSLMECNRINQIVIDTDSEFIIEDANRAFPEVRIIRRPDRLRGGHVSMNDVLLHDVEVYRADFYLQTHSTNPLLKPQTLASAIDRFVDQYPRHDSLFSVTRRHIRLWDKDGLPINHNPAKLLRTQDQTPVFEENSNIYMFTAENLKRCKNRISDRPMLFEIAQDEAWDIDEESDFTIAEYLHRQQQGGLGF